MKFLIHNFNDELERLDRIIVFSFQARMVATAVNSLCEAANATVQGNASEEKLIASAKAVSNSTAQLLLASRVKADPHSEGQRRLQVSVGSSYYVCVTQSWNIPSRKLNVLCVLSTQDVDLIK